MNKATKEQIEAAARVVESVAELFGASKFYTLPNGDKGHYLQRHQRSAVQRILMNRAAELRQSASADPADEHHDAEERQARAVARNIINQIGDLWSEQIPSERWVQVRQESNDELDEFVTRLIVKLVQAESEDHAATVTGDRKKLIAEARKFVSYGSDLNTVEADRLISELCDALSAPVEVYEAKLADLLYRAWNEEQGNAIPFLSSEARTTLSRIIVQHLKEKENE